MKNKLLTLAVLSTAFLANAQVGINTSQAAATFDVVGFPSINTKADGMIAPRLTGDQLRAKSTAYTASQTGAIVYVTVADSAPAGQTINVTVPGYYYFNGTVWIRNGADWHITGNEDAEIATVAETLGNAPASVNYLGTKGATDDLILVTGGRTHGVLDGNGSLKGGNSNTSAPFSSLSWGSNNTISNATSSSIALGRSNTVSASAANFPGVAIGANNTATNGAKLIGNGNSGDNSSAYVLGNNNTITSPAGGFAVGNSNTTNGFVFGTGNIVTVGNYAFGNNNNVTGSSNAMVFGIGTANNVANQTVYGNGAHVFSGQGTVGSAITDVGVNMVPSSTNIADLEVNKGILLKQSSGAGAPAAPGTPCDSSNAGTLIYWMNTSTGVANFYGCRQLTTTPSVTFGWTSL
ncbi:hypothetical protein MUU74_07630 [Chryseobacterium daecheongense]|uniref:hypothetical protein n=1 Tax=Chryseobacterium daecheongense TaxID=192389 RepID=UPI001FD71F97|nr:hypothetical protein [Chryseobacterium daecheongense]UOU99811.1 hypothetical protein MUU74_07630 [Chryseobacterium daecheongense]